MSSWGQHTGPMPPDDNRGPWILGLVWAIRALALIVVALRIFTRTKAKNTAGWDDLCICISACLTIFGGVDDALRVANGWPRHVEYLTPAQIEFQQKWMTIGELNNFCSTFFVRLSVCIFVLRLLPDTQKWPRAFTWGAVAINFISTLVNCIVFSTRCIPMAGIWDTSLNAKCLSLGDLAIAFGVGSACGVIVDFVVIIVPVFVIRNLQMDKRTKIGISVIMCLSFITALCSIGKMVTSIHLEDPVYDTAPVFIFSIFEEDLGIICASMPAMRQLYKYVQNKRKGHQRIPDSNNPYSLDSSRNEHESRKAAEKRGKSFDVELNEIDAMRD